MNSFIYYVPVNIYFGDKHSGKLGIELAKYGKNVLMTYGGGSIKKNGIYDGVVDEIKKAGLNLYELPGIEPNPRIESVREGVKICKQKKIDVLLAVGGGSTIDATKFMAAGAVVDHDPWDFLNEEWKPIENALPVVTVLTLAATGSEMDCGGVITNTETKDKIGRMEPALLPRASFLNPANTFTVSPYQTACGAADILSHIIEVYFNMNNDMYMLDCVMEGLMKTVIKYAPVAMREPDNYEARANLMWASSWAINGFINGGKNQDWSCHPMEHELSAVYDITHGLGLAILTPRWLEFCLSEATIPKYVQFGVNVLGVNREQSPRDIARCSIDMLSEFLYETLGLKRSLHEVGIDKKNFGIMAYKASASTKNAFVPLDAMAIMRIYEMSLD